MRGLLYKEIQANISPNGVWHNYDVELEDNQLTAKPHSKVKPWNESKVKLQKQQPSMQKSSPPHPPQLYQGWRLQR